MKCCAKGVKEAGFKNEYKASYMLNMPSSARLLLYCYVCTCACVNRASVFASRLMVGKCKSCTYKSCGTEDFFNSTGHLLR